jgi:hypothetical protein
MVPLCIPKGLNGEIWVRVQASVLRGESGFGLLNRAGNAYQDRNFVAAGADIATTFLQVKDVNDLQCPKAAALGLGDFRKTRHPL